MSAFITSTDINMLIKVNEIIKSDGRQFSGVYPTDLVHVYIVSTWGEAVYQTVNAITREIQSTTESDFRDFVEGKL